VYLNPIFYVQGVLEAADQYLESLINSLSSVQQLCELRIETAVGPCCLASLQAASHLTLLQLRQTVPAYRDFYTDETFISSYLPSDLSALSTLSSLRHLSLERCGDLQPRAAGNTSSSGGACSSSCLPSGLVALDLTLHGLETAHWLHHLSGCPGLQQLSVAYRFGRDHLDIMRAAGSAPSNVLDLAAQHTTRLTSLVVKCSADCNGWPAWWQEAPPHWQLPLNPYLAHLTQLQQLRLCRMCQLKISTGQEWRHFACMASLKCVEGVNFTRAPPAGVTLQQVTHLSASLELSAADMGLLLAAFPALEEVALEITPKEAHMGGTSSTSRTPAAEASAAATAIWPNSSGINVSISYEARVMAEAAELHFAAAAPVLASLRRLSLTWPWSSSRSPHLPDLGALTALTSLSLAGPGRGSFVRGDHLLRALQPLSATLRQLSLVTPRVVLALQAALPALQRIDMLKCGRPPPESALDDWHPEVEQPQLLKRFLRPGLSVCYAAE
jgi:hypothetical protein